MTPRYGKIRKEVTQMLNARRLRHSLGVENMAVKLAEIYGADAEKCRIAAIAHDCAKNMSDEELIKLVSNDGYKIDSIQEKAPQLLHGMAASILCRDRFGVKDKEILNAIAYHTTGRAGASKIEKIIYLSDMIEEGRDFPEVNKLREKALTNLDEAVIMACDCTLQYIISRGQLIHPMTVEFRNSLLLKNGEKR